MEQTIKDLLIKLTGVENVQLEVPVREEHGDLSTNIAMVLYSQAKKVNKPLKIGDRSINFDDIASSKQLAEAIAQVLKENEEMSKFVREITVVEPGFINFWLSDEVLFQDLQNAVQQGPEYGSSNVFKGKKIMIEYGDANTHKLPHIGHLFSYIYGESLARIFEAAGAEVYRASYQGDVGPHVAKCLWAYKKEEPVVPEDLEEKVKLLQQMYQKGSEAHSESETVKKEITELNKAIYNKSPEIHDLWQETRQWSIDYYKRFEERLGIDYDRYYYESEVYEQGRKIVENNVGKVFTKSQGAIIFEGSKYGLHDRVFVTQYGTPTYEAKDMYLQRLKMEEWPMDKLIITTAHEQNEYFKVIYKALEVLDEIFKGKLEHIGFGMVNLKTGKMSSRKGEIIEAFGLVDMTVRAILEIIQDREELSEQEKEDISEMVGQAAVKYSFLKSNPLQDIAFDLKESINLEGNSGPYLQYTVARTNSVLANSKLKTQNSKIESQTDVAPRHSEGDKSDLSTEESQRIDMHLRSFADALDDVVKEYELNEEEYALLRHFVHFQGTIVDAAKNYSPNLLANYLYELAQRYNAFYNAHKIIDSKEQELRLALTAATGEILNHGLDLLGIQAPEKM